MEPAFYRGDILFLINPTDVPYEVGDITVYKVYVSVFFSFWSFSSGELIGCKIW